MTTIFLSHKSEDDSFVTWLATQLRAAGFQPWVDHEDIEAGEDWDERVEAALEATQVMVLVLTPLSAASDNVKDEWSYFFDEKKPIVPILLEACKVPYRLRRVQRVDFTGDHDKSMAKLVKALEKYRKAQPPPPPPTGPRKLSKISPKVLAILDMDEAPKDIRRWWGDYRTKHPRITDKPGVDGYVQLYLAGIVSNLTEREHYQLRRYLFMRYCDDDEGTDYGTLAEEKMREYFYAQCRRWRKRYAEDHDLEYEETGVIPKLPGDTMSLE